MDDSFLSLFWQPYLAGLAMAILLPLLGLYLRLREEWLAALAYGQVGAAGALLALPLGVPGTLGGLAASLAVALTKGRLDAWLKPGVVFPLLLLLGWGASLLLSANLPVVERLGHALFEGQLYFVGRDQLYLSLGLLVLGGAYLWRRGRFLLVQHLYPASETIRGSFRLHFDLLAAAGMAVAVMSLGVMGAFALAFVPPWVAFVQGQHWRQAAWWAVLLSVFGYTLAFAGALYLDQPLGPLLVVTLVALGLCTAIGAKGRITKAL